MKLSHLDIENLTAPIGAAGGAGGVGVERSATLGAFAEFRRMPAVGSLAGAKAHLGCFAFRDSHRTVVF